jgi:hypothetical protein
MCGVESFRIGLLRSYLDRRPAASQSISFLESLRSDVFRKLSNSMAFTVGREPNEGCSTPFPATNQKIRATPNRETRSVSLLEVSARRVADGSHAGLPQSSTQFCRRGVRSVDLGRAKSAPSGWNLGVLESKDDSVMLRGFAPRTPKSKTGRQDGEAVLWLNMR